MKTIAYLWVVGLLVLMGLLVGAGHCQTANPDAPLPWKTTFDWKFAAVHAGYFGAMMYDQHRTLQGEAQGCGFEDIDGKDVIATRGDLMKKNMPYFSGIVVADALLRHYARGGGRFWWLIAPSVASAKHLYGASQWCH